jgi:hypothetical protein
VGQPTEVRHSLLSHLDHLVLSPGCGTKRGWGGDGLGQKARILEALQNHLSLVPPPLALQPMGPLLSPPKCTGLSAQLPSLLIIPGRLLLTVGRCTAPGTTALTAVVPEEEGPSSTCPPAQGRR